MPAPQDGPQWWQQMVAAQAAALGPPGHDSFGNFPQRAGPGRASPRTPRERPWDEGQEYLLGDVITVGVAGVGAQMLLCRAEHTASAARSWASACWWEPYLGEVPS